MTVDAAKKGDSVREKILEAARKAARKAKKKVKKKAKRQATAVAHERLAMQGYTLYVYGFHTHGVYIQKPDRSTTNQRVT